MDIQETARIRHIMIYPVKSAAGIEMPSAMLTKSGLAFGKYTDHQFMVVRAQPDGGGIYNFITQRDKREEEDRPQGLSVMALIKPEFAGDGLRLTWEYQDPIEVPYGRDKGAEIPVRVWDHECYAVDQGDDIAEWFTGHMNLPVRLVEAAGSFARETRRTYMNNDNPLQFQDAYPIHWFSMESVNELSQIAGQDIPWESFRPQVVADGMPPQYEHKVASGNISGVPFLNPKPCDRCPITLVDQETGKVRGKEPLASLSKYKKWVNRKGELKVIFGENMLPLGSGKIAVGDEIAFSSHRDPPLLYGADIR